MERGRRRHAGESWVSGHATTVLDQDLVALDRNLAATVRDVERLVTRVHLARRQTAHMVRPANVERFAARGASTEDGRRWYAEIGRAHV